MWQSYHKLSLYFSSGYVDEIKKLLFSLSRAEMKETFTKYSSKAPASLTSQFPDRVGKADAVKAYEERTRRSLNSFQLVNLS